jgi:signal transduction histidine kinase
LSFGKRGRNRYDPANVTTPDSSVSEAQLTFATLAVLSGRLADACARVRGAVHLDDVLDVAAHEACALTGGRRAWAARLEHGNIASIRSSSSERSERDELATPPLAAILANAKPTPRSENGFLFVALLGSGNHAEGILAVTSAGVPADGAAELVLAQLAAVVGLAVEAARLRTRVEVVSKARETLLASVSHDLRNPLNTFAMSTGLLRDDLERNDVDATRGISLVSRMDRATSRMQSLIEDLVEASRVDAKKIDYAIREESAAQLLKDAATAAAPTASEKGAAVVCDSLDESARVTVDRARTLQLIAKVIAFEAKSTGDGGTIRLGVSAVGGVVTFSARAFGPAGTPVPPPAEGRGGLALLLARGLTEGQRGTFRIEPGDSLVVSFTLPGAKP